MSDAAISGIDIHTYFVKDAARAVAFWRDVMGLRPTEIDEGMGGEFVLPDGATFGLWKMEDGSWQAGGGIMFAVADARAAADAFRSRGVKVAEHIEETPVCYMAFAEDSEGNSFVLHQRKRP
ncbi:MAG: VOC family protein [Vulcanimicrobiaceae bacterium]